MTTMTDSVVDMSGVIRPILQKYREALVAYQQAVTGDPAAVKAAATKSEDVAQRLTTTGTGAKDRSNTLHTSWTGDAYDSYQKATGNLADELTKSADALTKEAETLNRIATGLTVSRQNMDQVLAEFDRNANQLLAESTHAAASAANQFVAVAQQLGEQAVSMAKQVVAYLNGQLDGTGEALPKDKGLSIFDWQKTWQGTGQSYLGNGVMAEYGGYFGIGPKLDLSGKLIDEKGHKGIEGDLDLNLQRGGLYGQLSDGTNTVKGKIDESIGADGKLKLTDEGLAASGKIGVEVKGEITASQHLGDVTLENKLDGSYFYGAKGDATFTDGKVHLDGKIGESAELNGTTSVEAGGVKLGLTGGVSTGEAAQGGGDLSYENGHLKLGAHVGLTDGVGAQVGFNVDIDVPKVEKEIGDAATWAYNGVSNAAGEAADAIGRAFSW